MPNRPRPLWSGAREIRGPGRGGLPAVACSLASDLIEGKIEDWKSTVEQAKGREATTDGVRLRFSRDVDVAALAVLAAAEQTCCDFFTFTIGIQPDDVTIDVTGPPEARSVISAMFGVPD